MPLTDHCWWQGLLASSTHAQPLFSARLSTPLRWFPADTMVFRLPEDVLVYISDYLQKDSLSQVCCRGRRIVRGRHVACCFSTDTALAKVSRLKGDAALHSLTMQGSSVQCQGIQELAALSEAPSLTSLTLSLGRNHIGPAGAQALAALKNMPVLANLSLGLRSSHIGSRGAQVWRAQPRQPPWNA